MRIRTVKHLAKMLHCSPSELHRFSANPRAHYRFGEFTDKKGKPRRKAVPVGRLRVIMKSLNNYLQRLVLHDSQHGGRKRRSYVTNAKQHLRRPVLIKRDIHKFFPSVTTRMAYRAFRYRCRCSPEVAAMLAVITTPDGCLPQGSPHSTIVGALVVEQLATRLSRLAKKHGAKYTQYVDDISLSGPKHLEQMEPLVCKIIRDEKFNLALDKDGTALKGGVEHSYQEQTVTGVRVNHQLDVTSKAKRDVQSMIDSLTQNGEPESLIRSIEGKISSIRQLNPGAARSLLRRLRRAQKSNG